jgi:endogenous inhibitor of DNA gyrase (YacG/DUF329 family)
VHKCPSCKKPVEWKDNPWRPFCSQRCQLIDFSRWSEEEYRVPGRQINPAELPEQPRPNRIDEENPSE